MIRVERKPFREYFFRKGNPLVDFFETPTFHSRRHLCQPGFIAFFLAAIFGVLGMYYRVALVFFITEIIFLALLYWHTRVIARGLTIRRILPGKIWRELDSAEVVIELKNASDFALSGLVVEDTFHPTKAPHVRLGPPVIRQRSQTRIAYRRPCDAGMGPKSVGPLVAVVTDPLGIFEFRVLEDEVRQVEIHPKVESIQDMRVRPSVEGTHYGNYEIASRGLSVNFAGVRQYELGDSLRHIAWKLSTRGQGLLVKEFERVVSCDVNIVLNLTPNWQIGRHAVSTWEYGKDIALAIIRQQLDLGNTVAFFDDRTFVPAGAGSDHFHAIAKQVAGLKIENSVATNPSEFQSPLARYYEFYPRGSNIFYITPFNHLEIEKSIPWLKRLKAEGFHVVCIFIDTNSFWLHFIESISHGMLIGAKLMVGLPRVVQDLERVGIEVFVVDNRKALRESLRQSTGGVVRVKT